MDKIREATLNPGKEIQQRSTLKIIPHASHNPITSSEPREERKMGKRIVGGEPARPVQSARSAIANPVPLVSPRTSERK